MGILVSILIAICVIGIVLWAINKVLGVVAIPEPFKTILWVLVVLLAVVAFLQMTGLGSHINGWPH